MNVVILDLDESLGSFPAALAFLITVAHVLDRDPFLRNLTLLEKNQLLITAAFRLIFKSARPGVELLLKKISELREEGHIQQAFVVTRARPSSEPVFAALETSPQQLLVNALLEMSHVSVSLLEKVIFSPREQKKNLHRFRDSTLFVLDDLPLKKNYLFGLSQTIHFFKLDPFFGVLHESVWFLNSFDQLLKEYKVHEKSIPNALETLLKRLKEINFRRHALQKKTPQISPRSSMRKATNFLLKTFRPMKKLGKDKVLQSDITQKSIVCNE